MNPSKLYKLEALRGIASIVVYLWHFVLAFIPSWVGATDKNFGIMGTPFFFVLNGHASVMVFFLLSGFVLTVKYYATDNTSILVNGIIKRYFRLLGPVVVTIMLAWLLFELNLYWYKEAAVITASEWLKDFAASGRGYYFKADLGNALEQAFAYVFLTGENYYCTNLWTMQYELFGSFIAMFLAPVFLKTTKTPRLIALVMFSIVCCFYSHYYLGFVAGAFLAWYYTKNGEFNFRPYVKVIMIIFSLILLGFNNPVGFYAPLKPLANWITDPYAFRTYIQFAGAMLLMLLFLSKGKGLNFLDGKTGKWLGNVSFPLYLAQLAVFCSFSSWLVVFLNNKVTSYTLLIAITFIGTTLVTFIFVIFLHKFDKRWVKLVNLVISNK
ncbi:MAG TPA: acyltransferase [Bacteroidia bacterium]|nr:acyltransferase [Bacteroidia bacterium]HNU32139.1 acyltransferase [Bacteroidia bacterium]